MVSDFCWKWKQISCLLSVQVSSKYFFSMPARFNERALLLVYLDKVFIVCFCYLSAAPINIKYNEWITVDKIPVRQASAHH